jgi:hypothetical protein
MLCSDVVMLWKKKPPFEAGLALCEMHIGVYTRKLSENTGGVRLHLGQFIGCQPINSATLMTISRDVAIKSFDGRALLLSDSVKLIVKPSASYVIEALITWLHHL